MSRKKPPGSSKGRKPQVAINHINPPWRISLERTALVQEGVTLQEGPLDVMLLELFCRMEHLDGSPPLHLVHQDQAVVTVNAEPLGEGHLERVVVTTGDHVHTAIRSYLISRCDAFRAMAGSFHRFQDETPELSDEELRGASGLLLLQHAQTDTYSFEGTVKACLSELLNAAEQADPQLVAAEVWGPGGVLCAWSAESELVWQPVIFARMGHRLQALLEDADEDLRDHTFRWPDYVAEKMPRGVTMAHRPGTPLPMPSVPPAENGPR